MTDPGAYSTASSPSGVALLDPVAVWAHGSLAGGDYQEGRSDLDLIAVLETRDTPHESWQAGEGPRTAAGPSRCARAAALHVPDAPDNADAPTARTSPGRTSSCSSGRCTPVTRRELHAFGRVLHGETAGGPAAAGAGPGAHRLRRPGPEGVLASGAYDNAAAVDPRTCGSTWGVLAFARASVTLRDGRLDLQARGDWNCCPAWGRPVELVEAIRQAPRTTDCARRRRRGVAADRDRRRR